MKSLIHEAFLLLTATPNVYSVPRLGQMTLLCTSVITYIYISFIHPGTVLNRGDRAINQTALFESLH